MNQVCGGANGMGRLSAIEYQPDVSGQYKLKEAYGYTSGGLVASKSLSYKVVNSIATVGASFAYNDEGQRTAIMYPRGWSDASGTWVQDAGVTRGQAGHPDQVIASGAAYNLNGQMLSATIQGVAHAWVYNSRGQMIGESAGTLMNFEYTFSATQNDGRVTRRKDYVSGEHVQYLYDSLEKLTQATGTGVAWSQSFTHDGFGNLTQRSGSGTPLSVTVNAKNQVTAAGYDANGNQSAIGTQEWDQPQFATYTRDGASRLDDAMNRQYDRIWGRFTAADPYHASAGAEDPGSWNRYAYVQGDPVNWADHSGLFRHCPDGNGCRLNTDSFYDASNGGAETRIHGIESNTGRGEGGAVSAAPPECNLRNEGDANIINLVSANSEAAVTLASETGLAVNFILAWAGQQCGWGNGSAAKKNNNYFGLSTDNWPDAITCPAGAFPGFTCFAVPDGGRSLLASGRSAVKPAGGRYSNPELEAQRDGGTASDIARAIANAGFNTEFEDEGETYGRRTQKTFDSFLRRLMCLE